MRVGDFGVELVPFGDAVLRETDSGHVLARPGTVYGIRLRNYGPLRAVVDVRLDEKSVTGGGLVINANSSVTLERPVHESETGRFTVIAEGNETVFGPDGGRDNPALGAIVASFRRELPQPDHRYAGPRYVTDEPRLPYPGSTGGSSGDDGPIPTPPIRPRPMTPPSWSPPTASARPGISASLASATPAQSMPHAQNVTMPPAPLTHSVPAGSIPADSIERAAGTGLTGHSMQEFVSVNVGTLESEATVIRLRLAIGTDAVLNAPRPLRNLDEIDAGPARPPARP